MGVRLPASPFVSKQIAENAPDDEERRRMEGRMERELSRYFEGLMERVVARLEAQNVA